jgi:hypothetical protein
MAATLPTGTVTFLFTDIEGSTQLLQQLGEAFAQVRADHHRLLRQAFTYSTDLIDREWALVERFLPPAQLATARADVGGQCLPGTTAKGRLGDVWLATPGARSPRWT